MLKFGKWTRKFYVKCSWLKNSHHFALRKAKIVFNFGLSECKRVKVTYLLNPRMDLVYTFADVSYWSKGSYGTTLTLLGDLADKVMDFFLSF